VAKSQKNIRHALKLLGVQLRYDRFHDQMLIEGLEGHDVVNDAAVDKLWLLIDERYKFLPTREFFYTVVQDAARRNSFHPVRDYLDGLSWDGVKRIDRWLIQYGGADDTEYVRAVSALTLVAAVRRIRKPGCKFDEMLVLESPQGHEKSKALAILAVKDSWFSDDLPLNADSKKSIEQMRGRWIIEAADMSGMRKATIEHLKAFLARQIDRARMSYDRLPTEMRRQCIIVGTTNDAIYLKDQTGNRRFWPVKVGTIDTEALRRDRDQIWAEAAAREKTGGSIRLDKTLWDAAAKEQQQRTVDEPWREQIQDVLGDLQGKLRAADAWMIVGMEDVGRRTQDHNQRLGAVMKDLGFERKSLSFDGRKQKAYARGTEEQQEHQILLVSNATGSFAAHTEAAAKAQARKAEDARPM
jgi:predicted P-loop ATPase